MGGIPLCLAGRSLCSLWRRAPEGRRASSRPRGAGLPPHWKEGRRRRPLAAHGEPRREGRANAEPEGRKEARDATSEKEKPGGEGRHHRDRTSQTSLGKSSRVATDKACFPPVLGWTENKPSCNGLKTEKEQSRCKSDLAIRDSRRRIGGPDQEDKWMQDPVKGARDLISLGVEEISRVNKQTPEQETMPLFPYRAIRYPSNGAQAFLSQPETLRWAKIWRLLKGSREASVWLVSVPCQLHPNCGNNPV
ncbi:uncharacterized protein LOC121925939 [Sceloporus undulatus]|uniref:uncharacterized protein LOC121925939 n=1 Tax=Sceloporus undulatus TaxID=8520 RepID=UPI001C4BB0B8|nr:uncharacterized protein LOC121925939 [Sceloporus undulatus]